MRKGATIFIGDPVASVRVFAKLAVKPKATAFFTLTSGTVGTYPSQGDHRDRGADALPHGGVGALFIGGSRIFSGTSKPRIRIVLANKCGLSTVFWAMDNSRFLESENCHGQSTLDRCVWVIGQCHPIEERTVPGPSDKAVIAAPGSYTVTVTTPEDVGSARLNDPGAILEIQSNSARSQ